MNSRITLSESPLENHYKFDDLIYYDGPILSHFIDSNTKDNYLYYWVDLDNEIYKWLIFKTTIGDLKEYLSGERSLLDTIQSQSVSYYFIADYLESGFSGFTFLNSAELSKEYLPEDDSYYTAGVPEKYKSLFSYQELSLIGYLDILKDNALYIQFSEVDVTHKHILTIDQVTQVLGSVQRSYKSYVEDQFKKNFSNLFPSINDLSKGVARMQDNLKLRVVDAKIASFGIGLSVDTIMLPGDIKTEIRDWSKNVITDYRNEVIEFDYERKENIGHLLKQYTPEVRRNIYKPILDLYSSPNFLISVSRSGLREKKQLKKITKELVYELVSLPTTKLLEDQQTDKEFLTIAFEVSKGQEIKNIKKISSAPLFEKRSDSLVIPKDELEYEDLIIKFKSSINIRAEVKDNLHYVFLDDLNLEATGISYDQAMSQIAKQLHELWLSKDSKADVIESVVSNNSKV